LLEQLVVHPLRGERLEFAIDGVQVGGKRLQPVADLLDLGAKCAFFLRRRCVHWVTLP